jgi:spermidine synthase
VSPAWGGPAVAQDHRRTAALLAALLVVSGFAALVYQVLWVRQLALLLGSTAQAAALAIAIFFGGLALGGAWWGRRSARVPSPLRLFGVLELSVAATALGHLVLLDVYHALYPVLYARVGANPALDLAAKLTISTLVLLPPAFLMGGTLPALGQHLIRRRDQLGRVGSRLYALNTAGSALGALAAGAFLPLLLGFRGTYLLAVGLDVAVGLTAVMLSRGPAGATVPEAGPSREAPPTRPTPAAAGADRRPPPRAALLVVAGVSGAATLAVEVLWTRLFAQVLQNSVQTYALVLTTFLVALAAGAAVANRLCRVRRVAPATILLGLLGLSAIATVTSPWVFHTVTDGLAYVGADRGWYGYLAEVVTTAVVVILPAATVFGTVLPFLLRTLEAHASEPGPAIGQLVAVNTAGAVVGSLLAGFVLLPVVGITAAMTIAAGCYLLALLAVGVQPPAPRRAAAAATATAVVAALALAPTDLAALRAGEGERVLELREGVQATVAVVDSGASRAIRVNSAYTLGSSGARHAERDQTLIPLLTHPTTPRSVFFLGMGTGITAGAAVPFPLERIVVCELIDDVVDAARDHFRPWTGGLFTDERVEIHAEDGRTCLRRSPERYDLIVSDLFTPWKAGTGNLYTREHYRIGRDRLEPGGRYVQWLPLYQVSERELGSIAATMDEVFDEVVMWRGDHFASRSIVALVGHVDPAPLDVDALVANVRELAPDLDEGVAEALLLRMYVGNVTASGRFDGAPRNTDQRPYVEHTAPRTHREARVGAADLVVGAHRERLYDDLATAVPPTEDPYLSELTDAQLEHVRAGRALSAHRFAEHRGDLRSSERALQRFGVHTPDGSEDLRSPARELLARIDG